ncbi:hypothetical protein [Occallatibacter savannae]|uniref:hypothetical protein n=1 Tax=Occallatibacter savannae TaxID=1002691 RepID=UPI000D6959FE|nr:hypothetical protein [Occallatibacter savannae]
MNRYILIRRLRGPAILVLAGVIALLHEAGLVEFWSLFFPLLLITIGVLKLAERAALAAAGDEVPYAGSQYPYGAAAPGPGVPQPPAGAAIVPAATQDYGRGSEGGQS